MGRGKLLHKRIVGDIDGVQLEAEARIASQIHSERNLLTVLKDWLRFLKNAYISQAERMLPGEYTIRANVGSCVIRYVSGRDPRGDTFAL